MVDASKTVFISYRRSVSSYIARAIFMDLTHHGYDVFMDVESIDSGAFGSIILNQVAARAHFLVVLTPGTVERFAQPEDWMRREIEYALDLKRNIVPLLVDNFSFSAASAYLTGKLERLPHFNGLVLYHDYFQEGMEKLRDRFLKQPVAVDIRPTPAGERDAVQRKVEAVAGQEEPSKAQLSAEEYFTRGLSKYDDGAYQEAIAEYDQAIRLNPQYADAYFNRGLAYYHLEEYQGSIDDYDQAIQLDPKYADAYFNRGIAYRKSGDNERAIADYDQAILLNPQDAAAYNNRGNAYRHLGDHRRAIADYDQAIRLDPEYAAAYNNRGNAYGSLGEYQRAIENYDQAIRLNSQYALAYENRGKVYEKLGDKKHAQADFERAKKIRSQAGGGAG